MKRSIEDLEKIAKVLRELLVQSLDTVNAVAGLSASESNSIIVGTIQNIYAELCAAMVINSKDDKKEVTKEFLLKSFNKQFERALQRETALLETANKLAGMSTKDIADRLVKGYNLDDDDSDDNKGPKNFN